jgi:hypothetical protein
MSSNPEVTENQSKQEQAENSKSFNGILVDELSEIQAVRKLKNDIFYAEDISGLPSIAAGKAGEDNESRAAESQLTGLAFSGGGIRSATFNLGILQGLAKYKMLPRIDYISTVSGGGYIGSWLTTWIKSAGIRRVIEGLAPTSERTRGKEPKPISHLRQFSNYLTPRVGLLNADTLTAASIYLRNLLLNLIILTALLGGIVLLPRLISFSIEKIEFPRHTLATDLAQVCSDPGIILGLLALAAAYAAVIFIYKNLTCLKKPDRGSRKFYRSPLFIKGFIVSMLFLACLLIAISILARPELWQSPWSMPLMITAALIANPFVLIKADEAPWSAIFLLISTALGAYLVRNLSVLIDPVDDIDVNFWVVLGTPALLMVFSVCGSLYIGLMGTLFDTDDREWLSRLGAWILIAAAAHTVLFGLAIYGPFLIEKAYPYLKAGLLSGWLLTTIGGVLTGKSQAAVGKKLVLPSKILTTIAPYVFILGLLILISLLMEYLYGFFITDVTSLKAGWAYIASGVMLFIGAAFGLSTRVDINAFSMHNFYRNRLIRCYIGASDDNRNQDRWTGFDMQEHCVRLCEMANTLPRSLRKPNCPSYKELPYQGPYHILNTTLNLVGGDNLAWQKRKASSFILSPLFCGYDVRPDEQNEKNNVPISPNSGENEPVKKPSKSSGYRSTHLYANDISLGTAMAISGAAVSPSMGHYSSPAVAFLMTVFNLRLGQWLGNPKHHPKHRDTWKAPGPKMGLPYLFLELLSLTTDQRGYVYLSDGGHFENLGLYELVRRRCRYIIVCDAGQDESMQFKELGAAIEKCRTDFGIDIDIDVDPIRIAKSKNFSSAHCVVGKIKYDHAGPEESHGILVYIKASLTGDEPEDVISYAAQNKKFPHQSTSDQWFDESQFESYRALGQHIAESIFNPIAEQDIISRSNELIFVELFKHWYPPSEAVAATFTKHSSSLANLYSQIRQQGELKFLDTQLIPEWEQLSKAAHIKLAHNYLIPQTENELRAGFYMVYQMIQLMENVYIDLNLEKEYDHPDNRGWMNIFRTWSWSGMFRVGWAISAGTFGARFQSFCKRHLDLDVGDVVIGEQPDIFNLKKAERQDLFSDLRQRKELNFVEEKFLRKFIEMLALSFDDNWLSEKAFFPLSYYPLKLRVPLPRQQQPLFFHFGFALMSNSFQSAPDIAMRYSLSKQLVYFRVQDHVRKMGFGRKALFELLDQHKKQNTFIRLYDLKQFEENQDKKYGHKGQVEDVVKNEPLFPEEEARKNFDILFNSVRQGIRFI